MQGSRPRQQQREGACRGAGPGSSNVRRLQQAHCQRCWPQQAGTAQPASGGAVAGRLTVLCWEALPNVSSVEAADSAPQLLHLACQGTAGAGTAAAQGSGAAISSRMVAHASSRLGHNNDSPCAAVQAAHSSRRAHPPASCGKCWLASRWLMACTSCWCTKHLSSRSGRRSYHLRSTRDTWWAAAAPPAAPAAAVLLAGGLLALALSACLLSRCASSMS